ncbi:hypothetical protein MTO96_007890 [Rhipicephalus appendiculatus]
MAVRRGHLETTATTSPRASIGTTGFVNESLGSSPHFYNAFFACFQRARRASNVPLNRCIPRLAAHGSWYKCVRIATSILTLRTDTLRFQSRGFLQRFTRRLGSWIREPFGSRTGGRSVQCSRGFRSAENLAEVLRHDFVVFGRLGAVATSPPDLPVPDMAAQSFLVMGFLLHESTRR